MPHTPSHFLKIHLNIILPSAPGFSKWSPSSGFPTKILYAPILSPHACHMPRPSHYSGLDHPHNIWGEEYRSLRSSSCGVLHSPVTSSLVGPHIYLSTLFSNTLSLRSSLNVSDQVSHPYKTTAKTIVLYILIFIFLVFQNTNTYTYCHFTRHFDSLQFSGPSLMISKCSGNADWNTNSNTYRYFSLREVTRS